MRPALVWRGVAGWAIATVLLRVAGQHLLPPRDAIGTLVLFAASAPVMVGTVRVLCARLEPRRDVWPAAAVALLLPTLLLDPFSSAFFPLVFPNIPREAAGVFGGWMLWCCATGLAGVTLTRSRRS
jgi:hypothetical protein